MTNYTEAQLETLVTKGSKKNTRYFFLGEQIEKNEWKKLYEMRTTMRYGTLEERQKRAAAQEEQREQKMRNLFEVANNALITLGYTIEATSGASVYYAKGESRVRVSDHEVPMTEEREHNAANGGFTWAGKGIVLWHGTDANELEREIFENYGD